MSFCSKFALAALMISLIGADARGRGHLIPVEPIFDVNGPYAGIYAKLCEEKLFAGPNWVVRYHSTSNVELGISITKRQDGKFWVTVKQAKPPLASILPLAKSQQWNLKSALKTIEFHQAHAEVPETTVASIHRYWLSLLSEVRPSEQTSPPRVVSNRVTLFAKAASGKSVDGQLPAYADKDLRIYAVEDIVDDLVKICAEPEKTHDSLFKKIDQKVLQATNR